MFKKIITIVLAIIALLFSVPVNAQVFSQNQVIIPPYGGVLYATSSNGTSKISATTSPTVGYITATSTTATSTFAGGVRAACFSSDGTTCLGTGTITGTPGQVVIINPSGNAAASSTIFVDTMSEVGIGTTTPTTKLSIVGTAANSIVTAIQTPGAFSTQPLQQWNDGTSTPYIENYITGLGGNSVTGTIQIWDNYGGVPKSRGFQLTTNGTTEFSIMNQSRTATGFAWDVDNGLFGWGGGTNGGVAIHYMKGIAPNTVGIDQFRLYNPSTVRGIFSVATWGGLIVGENQSAGATSFATYNDTATAAAGTRATHAFSQFEVPTYTATNYPVTTTNAYTLNIQGNPIAGLNQRLTNSIGLNIASSAVTASTTNAIGLQVAAPTGAASNYAAIFTGGNVGIGTTSPVQKLDIVGTNGNALGLYSTSEFGSTIDLYGGLTTGKRFRIISTGSSDPIGASKLTFRDQTAGGADRLTIDTAGNVGIGSTTPSTNLSVQGNSLVSGTSTAGNLVATSTATIGSLNGVLKATNGLVSVATPGTDYQTFAYPFTPTTNYAVTNQATTGIAWFRNGVNASSTSNFDYAAMNAATYNSSSSPAYQAGKMVYDSSCDCMTFFNSNSNVSLQNGQELWMRGVNTTGGTIANGAAVYITGSNGVLPTLGLATATTSEGINVIGLATEAIPVNATGTVTIAGTVNGLNTSTYPAISNLFISTTTPGGLVPYSPRSNATNVFYRYRVGRVQVVSATVGSILVTPSTAAIANGDPFSVLQINAAGSQIFTNDLLITGSTTLQNFTAKNATTTSLAITSLGTAAGAFLAVNPQGTVIATTTPSGSSLIGTTGQVTYFSGTNTAVGTSSIFIATTKNVGIGTTTPNRTVTISSGTASQLNLTDGSATSNPWNFRAGNGSLDIGTSSPTTNATNTTSAIKITESATTALGVGTSSPWKTLSVTGTVGFDGLTSSSGTVRGLCLSSNNEVTVNSTSNCTVSSRKSKHDIAALTVNATNIIDSLKPSTFVYNDATKTNIGFIAEEVAEVNPLLAGYNEKGEPTSIDTTAVLSIVIKSLQESNKRIYDLENQSKGSTTLYVFVTIMTLLFGVTLLRIRYLEKKIDEKNN